MPIDANQGTVSPSLCTLSRTKQLPPNKSFSVYWTWDLFSADIVRRQPDLTDTLG
jgi:hypothetical protein